MSVMNDVDMYKRMVSKGIIQKPCSIDKTSAEFMMISKCDDMEETLVSEENIPEIKDQCAYFEKDLDPPENVAADYAESSIVSSEDSMTRNEWIRDNADKHNFMLTGDEESMSLIDVNESPPDGQDGDEETIATFVTAAGQQLALYAVEDSDEIFAVAVYDESGEPPTNFQFLMKADVERLIGEGAVRTVKKPTQIKKQLFTTEPSMFYSKTESLYSTQISRDKLVSNENRRIQGNSNLLHDPDLNLDVKAVPNILYTTENKSSDITYVMMDDCSVNIDNSDDCHEDTDSEGELVEQSTVQYILLEGDQSDSELTFDEIQATLQNMKTPQSKSPKTQTNKKPARNTNNRDSIKQRNYEHIMHHTSNCSMNNHTSNTSAERNFMQSRQELLDTLGDSASDTISDNAKLDISNGSIECISPVSVQTQHKTKRSRKQQLISVNRDDSEIIIQPASLLSEEETVVRKRGKRKRRTAHSGYNTRNNESKRMKKMKRKEVEIIEIDVDEEESMLHRKRDVVEITIDDSKDKYSSDKENEIIMVGDSEDESQQSGPKTTILQCQYCSRNFRQKRALESHLRVCSKSPSNAIRFNEQKVKHSSRTKGDTVKKQYACTICQTKFDVVLALARHVRAEHSQRKKRRFSRSSVEREPVKSELKEDESPVTMIRKIKRRKTQRPNNSWDAKQLNCTDCGRWFPSAALLTAHCLQHGTKKSEQQRRRCQICKKLLKSRLLYARHLKKHSTTQQIAKPVANIQKKLHTTRSVTRKITTLRKRGRPRKL